MSTISASTTSTTAYKVTADTTGTLVLQTGATPTTALTIDTSQNVGIGTSSPGTKLDVTGAVRSSVSGGTPIFYLSNGTTQHSIQNTSGALTFFNDGTERARIDSSGNLLVGGTANPNSGRIAPNVANSARFMSFINNSNSAEIGYIQNNSGTAVIYSTSSDYRLKDNPQPMVGALGKVAQLKPCTYTWKSTGKEGQGFIAHELQAVVPDAVCGVKDEVNEDGNPVYQGIDTSFLVATLTAAIQELKAELDAAKADIATLKGTA